MKEWFLNPENQNLLKTMIIASGFGVGFFVLKGLNILKLPFDILFRSFTTKISFTNVRWEELEVFNNVSKKIMNSKKWLYRSVTPMYYTSSSDNARGNVLSPGNGWFFCMLEGRIAFVNVQELNKEFGQQMLIHVTWLTRDNKRLSKLMLELKDVKPDGLLVNYLSRDGHWIYLGQRPKRGLETVFYPNNLKNELIEHYNSFERNKELNKKLGMVSKTVKLLYGPPGTGKTSLSSVLATIKKKDVYVINTANISDDGFIKAVQSVDNYDNTLFLFEDIDNNPSLYDRKLYTDADDIHFEKEEDIDEVIGSKKKIKSGQRLSLNILLNFLDGILTPQNLDVLITTNHLEKLDPAIYRDSRVNFLREVGYLGKKEIIDFLEYFYDIKLSKEESDIVNSLSVLPTGSNLMSLLQSGKDYKSILELLKEQ